MLNTNCFWDVSHLPGLIIILLHPIVGNMWAQTWQNTLSIVTPFPNVTNPLDEVNENLVEQVILKFSSKLMFFQTLPKFEKSSCFTLGFNKIWKFSIVELYKARNIWAFQCILWKSWSQWYGNVLWYKLWNWRQWK